MANYKPKTCPRCNIEFTPTSPARKYCTPECSKAARQELQRAYCVAHKDHIRTQQRTYRAANKESRKANRKRYREANREHILKQNRNYYEANRDKIRERNRKWRARNPDKVGASVARRARATLGGNCTQALIDAKWEASDKTCILCGQPIDETLPRRHRLGLTLEHLTPVSRGGKHNIDNTAFAHRACNASKRDKTLDEYREWQANLRKAS